jgi:large subunit ribosomal protein L23
MSETVALRPRLNEKTYGLAGSRVYVFDVDRSVNKHSIARAVESQFEVKVTKVKTANISGKSKRTISLSGKRVKYGAEGSRSDFKKAYVTLAEGQGLPFFDAIEEEEQKEQATQEKFDKVAAKQAEKDEKAAKKAAKKPAEKAAKAEKQTTKPKSAAKASTSAKAAKPAAKAGAETDTEEPEKKRGLKAWRGFRLRKKDGGNK